MSAPSMRIDSVDFYMRNVRTRMPFKYGVAILTSVPILHAIVNVTVEGKRVQGIAADILPPKWFDKDPEKEYEDNEARRKIKVIRPEFIRRVVSEFERVMSA